MQLTQASLLLAAFIYQFGLVAAYDGVRHSPLSDDAYSTILLTDLRNAITTFSNATL